MLVLFKILNFQLKEERHSVTLLFSGMLSFFLFSKMKFPSELAPQKQLITLSF